jgi:hypothetical protein
MNDDMVIEKVNGSRTSKVETVEIASWRDGLEGRRQDIAMARTSVTVHFLGVKADDNGGRLEALHHD